MPKISDLDSNLSHETQTPAPQTQGAAVGLHPQLGFRQLKTPVFYTGEEQGTKPQAVL
jgi:hypothetical protein